MNKNKKHDKDKESTKSCAANSYEKYDKLTDPKRSERQYLSYDPRSEEEKKIEEIWNKL